MCGAYPRLRPERGEAWAAKPITEWARYESTNGEVTTADTDADVLVCSGVADAFLISARTNGALVTITNRLATEDDAITVLPGENRTIRMRGDRVRARSLVGGSASALSVTALYAAKGEAVHQAP